MDDRLSKTDLRVLGAIISFVDKSTGSCWPKREQIANRCGLSLPKISTSTTHLVTLGWLEKEGKGGCSRSVNYKLRSPDLVIKTIPDSGTVPELGRVPDSGTTTVPDSGTITVPDSGTGIKQTIEQTIEQTKDLYAHKAMFDSFWSNYPKKKSKPQALKAWLKMKPSDELANQIIESVKRSANHDRDWLKDGGTYIPFPATYLNGQRWEDEISKPTQIAHGNVTKSGPMLNTLTGGTNYGTTGIHRAKLSLVDEAQRRIDLIAERQFRDSGCVA